MNVELLYIFSHPSPSSWSPQSNSARKRLFRAVMLMYNLILLPPEHSLTKHVLPRPRFSFVRATGPFCLFSTLHSRVLTATWVGCPISGFLDPHYAKENEESNTQPAEDPRAMIALARTNWLHSHYNIVSAQILIRCGKES